MISFVFGLSLIAAFATIDQGLADPLTNAGLIWGTWSDYRKNLRSYHPYPPCYDDNTCVHAICAGIENTTFCNGAFTVSTAELIDENDFEYVDEQCQLSDITFSLPLSDRLRFEAGENTTVYGSHWKITNGWYHYPTIYVPLKPPGEDKFHFLYAFLLYNGTSPGPLVPPSFDFKFFVLTNDWEQGNVPVKHDAITRAQFEELIYNKIVVPKNLTDVTCNF